LHRTVKRKSLGKGRRRPTRRYSRVQRGGLGGEANAGTSLPSCVTIDEYLSSEEKKKFGEWVDSPQTVVNTSSYSSTMREPPYPVKIVNDILKQILSTDKKLCKKDIDIITKKIQGFDHYFKTKLIDLRLRN
jgi:hypothetical protein